MTPIDQTLVDQMHDKLKVKPVDLIKLGMSAPLGDSVRAKFHGGRIVLTVERDGYGPYQIIELLPETFQALEKFAEQIGWRCS